MVGLFRGKSARGGWLYCRALPFSIAPIGTSADEHLEALSILVDAFRDRNSKQRRRAVRAASDLSPR